MCATHAYVYTCHIVFVRVACGSNIHACMCVSHTLLSPTFIYLPSTPRLRARYTITNQCFKLWSPLKSFLSQWHVAPIFMYVCMFMLACSVQVLALVPAPYDRAQALEHGVQAVTYGFCMRELPKLQPGDLCSQLALQVRAMSSNATAKASWEHTSGSSGTRHHTSDLHSGNAPK